MMGVDLDWPRAVGVHTITDTETEYVQLTVWEDGMITILQRMKAIGNRHVVTLDRKQVAELLRIGGREEEGDGEGRT